MNTLAMLKKVKQKKALIKSAAFVQLLKSTKSDIF